MDIRRRIIELLFIAESSLDRDPHFFDDMHYRRLYVQATQERMCRRAEFQRLVEVILERLSEQSVNLSSPHIIDRSASHEGLIFTVEDVGQLQVLLHDYKALLAHEKKTREIVEDILVTWELARDAYRKDKRSDAAQLMNWTSGKRGKVIPEREIFSKYLKLTNGEKGQPKVNGAEAVTILNKKYSLQSEAAVVQILKRVKAAYKRVGINFESLRLPNTWPKQ